MPIAHTKSLNAPRTMMHTCISASCITQRTHNNNKLQYRLLYRISTLPVQRQPVLCTRYTYKICMYIESYLLVLLFVLPEACRKTQCTRQHSNLNSQVSVVCIGTVNPHTIHNEQFFLSYLLGRTYFYILFHFHISFPLDFCGKKKVNYSLVHFISFFFPSFFINHESVVV